MKLILRMPLYRRDLDMLAVSPGGELTGFCTLWFDDSTRTAYFEPVGVLPRPPETRPGQSGDVHCPAPLHRLKPMDGVTAFVSGSSAAAHALYSSVTGTEYDIFKSWLKEWV